MWLPAHPLSPSSLTKHDSPLRVTSRPLLCSLRRWREATGALPAVCCKQLVNFPYANPICMLVDLFRSLSSSSQFLAIDGGSLRGCSLVLGLPFLHPAHLFLLLQLLSWTDGSHIPMCTPIFLKSRIFSRLRVISVWRCCKANSLPAPAPHLPLPPIGGSLSLTYRTLRVLFGL